MKKIFALLSSLIIGVAIDAQDGLPSNPKPGKCYVKCVTEDVYQNESVRILVAPAYKKLKVVPSQYKTETVTYVSQEASKTFEIIPATYKTVTEKVLIKDGYNPLSIIPAKFNSSSETVEIKPKSFYWEYGTYPGCLSDNPDDCRTLCYKEAPSQSTSVSVTTLLSDATTTSSSVAAKYKTIYRKVIDQPASVREIPIPQKTSTYTKQVLVKDETVTSNTVPAQYKEVSKEVLVKKGGVSSWTEVDCGLLKSNILPIYYELGSARLTQASKRVIDEKIYKLMRSKPGIKVQIMSHTDSRGSNASNLALSQARAQSVVNYLVSKGINRSQLIAKGYGESRLVNGCKNGVSCSESKHQENRRTEFRVLGE